MKCMFKSTQITSADDWLVHTVEMILRKVLSKDYCPVKLVFEEMTAMIKLVYLCR